MAGILEKLPKTDSPNLLVGLDTMDDAGVFRLTPDVALVQTVDFFYPVVNDPQTFGRIVAANSLSDVWAMGAKALTAMNILAYPAGKITPEAIEALLIGGSEKLQEAGVVLVGGHTMEQEEFVYGMSVTGVIHPKRVFTNSGGRQSDQLILTKPLGTGVYSNALAKDGLTTEQFDLFVTSMERLNMYAAEVLGHFDVSAVTDVTGFGLLGHALPIARNTGRKLIIRESSVPRFPGIMDLMERYNSYQVCKCEEFVEPYTMMDEHLSPSQFALLAEAQTSGGLLAAVHPKDVESMLCALREAGDETAAIIGEVAGQVDTNTEHPYFLEIVP